mmetsp:Transcript_17308/g.16978  ORF Transcript_17308/g.16978 Transcript_17308/m.16978 type:complete len:84 (-) Transcript_17308:76-327(-)
MDFGDADQSMTPFVSSGGMDAVATQQPIMEPYGGVHAGGAPPPSQIPQTHATSAQIAPAPVPVQYPADPNAPYVQPPGMAPAQ